MNLLKYLKYFQKKITAVRSKKIPAVFLAVMGTVLILFGLFFSLRNVILKNIIANKIQSYQNTHRGNIFSIGSAKFSGFDRIDMKNIRWLQKNGALAIDLRSGSIRVAFWKMIVGHVRLRQLVINNISINIYHNSSPDKHLTRSTGKVKIEQIKGQTANISIRLAYWLDKFFKHIPDNLAINNLTIKTNIDLIRQTIRIPRLETSVPNFETRIQIDDQQSKWACNFTGSINRTKKQLAFSLLPIRRNEKIALPFSERQWSLRLNFDSAALILKSNGLTNHKLNLAGLLAVNGLTLNHPRIAVENVYLQNASIDYILHIGKDFLESDKSTLVSFNSFSFHPYLKFKVLPASQLTLKIDRTEFRADNFFSSLPSGLFTRLAGIRTSGELAYHLDFFIDFSRPQELLLESGLEKSNFRIEQFGRIDFRYVKTPFLYSAYEKDRALRSFMVGPENPDFRSLEQIPLYLKNAVLISEDGAFFGHKGFLLEPFKESIAANLKEKRFVRGASTISMQLVKNLYLKKQKTIARKLEEMLITWLIEENRLVCKERMLEIYLNIIEWGPDIYGVQEAARYYFDKDSADLTLAEAIFMASIIPRPKKFMYSFDQDRHLRPWLQAYYSNVSKKMLQREMISQQDYDTLVPDIRLKGPARFLLKGNEIMPDELLNMEDLSED